jgi:hypothetical protein
MMRRAVPNQRVGLSTARAKKVGQLLLPISFIFMLRKTFPVAWANMDRISTTMVFLKEALRWQGL